jgi:hypothetical protein
MAHSDGGFESRPAILDPPAPVKAAMRKGKSGQPLDALALRRGCEGSVNQA